MKKLRFDPDMRLAFRREVLENVSRRLTQASVSDQYPQLGICGLVETVLYEERDGLTLKVACAFVHDLIKDSPNYSGSMLYPVPPVPDLHKLSPPEIHDLCRQHFIAAKANCCLWSKVSYYGRMRRAMALEISHKINKLIGNK